MVARNDQCATGRAATQRLYQGGSSAPLRGRDVECADALGKIQCLRNDACVQAAGVGERGRGQQQVVHGGRVMPSKAVARGFHRHGNGVFIVVAHGSLAATMRRKRCVVPGVAAEDRFALQPQTRDVGAEGEYAPHADAPFASSTMANPLLSTTVWRSSAVARKRISPCVPQDSTRMVSPGYTGALKRTSMRFSRAGS
ncbi:hypothetical protein D9M68_692890 [compost metagenome]